eukprot:1473142-Rhodomonas_salina.4
MHLPILTVGLFSPERALAARFWGLAPVEDEPAMALSSGNDSELPAEAAVARVGDTYVAPVLILYSS